LDNIGEGKQIRKEENYLLVFVSNKHGDPLMPCSYKKARLLLKQGKAKIYQYEPFTIQLLYGSSGYKQDVSVGIDTGAKYIGVSATSENRVLIKGTIELRDDVKALLETRKIYRRSRRNRKTRYRQPKFQNRTRQSGWLPPSIQSRVDNTMRWIDKFLFLLPNPKLIIEVGKFDIQKIENPDINGVEYQQGDMYEYRNRIAYLIAREQGKCQYCNKPYEKGNGWRLHHIWSRHKDRPQHWALLHERCHLDIHAKGEESKLQKKKPKSYKESAFMNIIRQRMFKHYPTAKFTYGNVTFQNRCDLGLEKTHYNDAIAISGIKSIGINPDQILFVKQIRVKKRSLHEATPRKGRKQKNTSAKRNSKNTKYQSGFYLNDMVMHNKNKGFVTGFCTNGVYVKDSAGEYITKPGKTYKQLPPKDITFLKHTRGWQYSFV
jgi:hypothetical protein